MHHIGVTISTNFLTEEQKPHIGDFVLDLDTKLVDGERIKNLKAENLLNPLL